MREAEQAVAAFEAVEVSVGCPDRRPALRVAIVDGLVIPCVQVLDGDVVLIGE